MDDAIRSKIIGIVKQKQYIERDVVYFLVESYKFLERKYDKAFGQGKYDRIKFYRDWTCHAQLHGTSYRVFRDFNKLIKAERNKPDARGHLDWLDSMTIKTRECFRDYGPLLLQEDIVKFLAEIGCSETFNWESFRVNLYEVIRDIPLVIKDEDKVVFSFECVAPIVK